MKFLRVHPDLAIEMSKIATLEVTGREDSSRVTAYMDNGEAFHLSYHEDFDTARAALTETITMMEQEDIMKFIPAICRKKD